MTFSTDILEKIDQLRFIFSKSLQLNKSKYPIVSIWKCKNQLLDQGEIDFDSEEWFLIYKSTFGTYIENLTEPQHHMLSTLLSGDTVQQSLEKLEAQFLNTDLNQDIQDLFHFLVKSEIVEQAY